MPELANPVWLPMVRKLPLISLYAGPRQNTTLALENRLLDVGANDGQNQHSLSEQEGFPV